MESSVQEKRNNRLSWLITSLLVILVAVLGALQYRWLGQVAEANRLQSKAALDTAVQRFAEDFNDELSRLLVALKAGRLTRHRDLLGPAAARALEDWRDTADFPELVQGIYLLDSEGLQSVQLQSVAQTGSAEQSPDSTISALQLSSDDPLIPLRDRLLLLLSSSDPRGPFDPEREPEPRLSMLAPEIPALILPYAAGPGGHRDIERLVRRTQRELRDQGKSRGAPDNEEDLPRGRRRHRRDPNPRPTAFIIVHLDQKVIAEQILPSLADRHFGDTLPFHLRVLEADDDNVDHSVDYIGGSNGGVIFEWGPDLRGRTSTVDAEAELFGPLLTSPNEHGRGRFRRFLGAIAAIGQLDYGRWRLLAQHPEGSLDLALDRAKRRNLLLASGILAVLAFALLLLTRNAIRARRLAQQQLDFVAGVTHEVMTPLAALRSAGQNLADGLITDPKQIGRYGQMIDREGRRLADLVGQVLAFARMQSHRPSFHPEALDPSAILEAVAEDLKPQLEAQDVELEKDLEPDLPPVLADRQALIRALGNLVGNAIKYGQEQRPGWVGLRCRRKDSKVIFEVVDRGPGIPSGERSAIFEPFFRGTHRGGGLTASAVPGTGLGLALVKHLVESQGGSVGLSSKLGQGSTFRIVLPIAVAEESKP